MKLFNLPVQVHLGTYAQYNIHLPLFTSLFLKGSAFG